MFPQEVQGNNLECFFVGGVEDHRTRHALLSSI